MYLALQVLREHNLYGKLSKWPFYHTQVKYLGHIISQEGIVVDAQKIEAIMGWPTPKNVNDVRSSMGLVGYYKSFVRGFSRVAYPITSP